MVNDTEDIIERLNIMLGVEGGEPSVSPTSKLPGKVKTSSGGLYIHTNMDMEQLSQNELILVHTLLHKFYASGHKDLKRVEIEKLHGVVRSKLNHSPFDKLDEK